MELFYLEEPSINRKEEAIDYINEFINNNSNINGVGILDDYLEEKSYEEWLKLLEELKTEKGALKHNFVPGLTYFLVRVSDNKIIGMINIRLRLNDYLSKGAGHIGYSIRPTERRNGYNKINLYLGLKVCNENGIDTVLMDADKDNEASWKTMESLGGIRIREQYNEEDKSIEVVYNIDVKKSLEKNKDKYEPMIYNKKKLVK